EGLRKVVDRMHLRHAVPEVEVLAEAKGLFVSSELVPDDGAANHRRAVDQRASEDAPPADAELRDGPPYIAYFSSRDVDERRLRTDGGNLGMRVEIRDLPRQPLREAEVVAVEAGDVLAGDRGQPAI